MSELKPRDSRAPQGTEKKLCSSSVWSSQPSSYEDARKANENLSYTLELNAAGTYTCQL